MAPKSDEVTPEQLYLDALDKEEADYKRRGMNDRVKGVQSERRRVTGGKSAKSEKDKPEPKGAPETATQPGAPETAVPPKPEPKKAPAAKRAPAKKAAKKAPAKSAAGK